MPGNILLNRCLKLVILKVYPTTVTVIPIVIPQQTAQEMIIVLI